MIIDFHTHIFPEEVRNHRKEIIGRDKTFRSLFSSTSSRMASAEELIDAMDESGVDISVVMGIGWENMDVCKVSNDYMIEAVHKFPKRLEGFCSVNPIWGEAAVEEIHRCVDQGLTGIGELHPDSQGFDISDKKLMQPLIDEAREQTMPIVIHASEPVGHDYPGKGRVTPDMLYKLALNFPEARLVFAHWGGGLPFYGLMPEVPDLIKNVFFDTAASPFLYKEEIFRSVTNIIGYDRVVLGTDFPLLDQNRVIRQLINACISDDAKEAILYKNGLNILGISG